MQNSAGPAGVFESEYRPDSAAPASNAPLGQTALSLSPRPTAGPGRGVGSTEPRVLRLRSTVSHAAGAALARPGSEERGWSLLPAPRSPLARGAHRLPASHSAGSASRVRFLSRNLDAKGILCHTVLCCAASCALRGAERGPWSPSGWLLQWTLHGRHSHTQLSPAAAGPDPSVHPVNVHWPSVVCQEQHQACGRSEQTSLTAALGLSRLRITLQRCMD